MTDLVARLITLMLGRLSRIVSLAEPLMRRICDANSAITDMSAWEAGKATSAAPTFFHGSKFTEHREIIKSGKEIPLSPTERELIAYSISMIGSTSLPSSHMNGSKHELIMTTSGLRFLQNENVQRADWGNITSNFRNGHEAVIKLLLAISYENNGKTR
jgi:hypothetical protein